MDGPPGRAAFFSERGPCAPERHSTGHWRRRERAGRGTARLRVPLSTVCWIFLGVSSIALFPIAVLIWLVTSPFDARRAILHRFTCFWASLYTWLNPAWPVRIDGREHVRPGVTYVMVANHQSMLDIL